MGSRRFAAVLVCALAGVTSCYSPSVDSCVYACNAGRCPDGLVCNGEQMCTETFDEVCMSAPGGVDTLIEMKPDEYTRDTNAVFTFSATSASATFECMLGTTTFTPCTSPQSYTSLGDGGHMFHVRAVSAAQEIDTSPASYEWTVDTVAPSTTIMAAPSDPSNMATPTFQLTSDDPDATFECSLDGGMYTACGASVTLPSTADGAHTFDARAKDRAGNVDQSPAEHTWHIDTAAPTISFIAPSPAANATTGPRVSFMWTSSETGTTVCKLDNVVVSCTGTSYTASVPHGTNHAFAVTVTDAAMNATTQTRTWNVDCTETPFTGVIGIFHFDEASGDAVTNAVTTGVPGFLGTMAGADGADAARITTGARLGAGAINFATTGQTVTWNNAGVSNIAMTLELWFKPAAPNSGAITEIVASADNASAVYEEMGGGTPVIKFRTNDGLSQPQTVQGIATAGVWHHVVATAGGGTMSLYIDNVLTGTKSGLGTPTFNLSGVRWGKVNFVSGGSVDEALIATVASSATDVTNRYCPL